LATKKAASIDPQEMREVAALVDTLNEKTGLAVNLKGRIKIIDSNGELLGRLVADGYGVEFRS
jgi:hypothetical protein